MRQVSIINSSNHQVKEKHGQEQLYVSGVCG